MAIRLLRLRPEAKRNDIIRVYNDTVMRLEAVIIGLERENAELKNSVEALKTASTTTEEV